MKTKTFGLFNDYNPSRNFKAIGFTGSYSRESPLTCEYAHVLFQYFSLLFLNYILYFHVIHFPRVPLFGVGDEKVYRERSPKPNRLSE
jgi:hypothetical protein